LIAHRNISPALAEPVSRAGCLLAGALMLALSLTGCAFNGGSSAGAGTAADAPALTGQVHGGQQPVSSANIQLFAVGTGGDGSASGSLMTSTVTTNTYGGFNLGGAYRCPGTPAEVYLLATGGNPGLGAGTANANLALMTGLGLCSDLSSSTFIQVNELTTVATVAALAPYMSSAIAIGSGTSDASLLASAMATIPEYVDTRAGVAPGPALPSGYTASTNALQTLGDILAICINSAGGVSGDHSSCGNLFAAATPPSGTAPTDTVAAALDILLNPAANAGTIFSLVPSTPPFVPTLSQAPANWSLPILPPSYGSIQIQSASYNVVEGVASVALGVTYTGSTAASAMYSTAPGTASAGTDFQAVSGTLSWAAGDSSVKSIVVPLYNPGASGTTRSFSLALSTPLGAALGSVPLSTVAISDSDTALAISTATLSPGTVSSVYGVTLAATGGVGAYTWSLSPATPLPAGLSLSSSGVISGTPSATGTTSVTFVVTDSATPTPQTAQVALALAVGLAYTPSLTVTSVQFPYGGYQMNGDNYTGGVIPALNWNISNANTGTAPVSNSGTLVTGTSTGTPSPIGFTFSGYTDNDTTNNRTFPPEHYNFLGGLADVYLTLSSSFNQTGAPETLQITGLDPTHFYTLIAYIGTPWWQNGGSMPASVAVGGSTVYIQTSNTLGAWVQATSTNSSAPTTANYAEFTNLTGASTRTLTLTGAFVGLAAFQVVDYGTTQYLPGYTPPLTPATLPTLPSFTTGSSSPVGYAPQVIVEQASQPVTVAPPGATINVGANFYAAYGMDYDTTMIIALVDASGNTVSSFSNPLQWGSLTILPSYQWSGPVSFGTPLSIPTNASGTYSLMLQANATGIGSVAGGIQLTPGSGVVQDNQVRYYIGSVIVSSSAPQPSYLPAATLNLAGYHLTFDDEFTTLSLSDSSTYNGSNWYTLNEACCLQPSDNAGSAMVGLSSPWNPYSLLSGGGLDIRLQENNNVWTSGVLTSVDSSGTGFSQQYGYFEMKAQFPPGIDTWPAFWLLNTAAKSGGATAGEIDVIEYIANPGFADTESSTLHDYTSNSVPQPLAHNLFPVPSTGFHTYGLLWTATTMTFYVDGAVTFECPTPSNMHQPYYLLVDLGVGAGFPTTSTPSVNDMKIQYIRAYSK
jgi:hypothetical protein